MEAILGVWDGYAIQGETVSAADLGVYIEEAIKQIEFVIGDPATSESSTLNMSARYTIASIIP